MAVCDMCGTTGKLFRTEVEGTLLNACENCSKFGKVLGSVREALPERKLQRIARQVVREETIQAIVENYPEVIRKKRESLSLTQEELALKLNEKVSLIHKMETGHYEPPIALARKIEKFLKVALVEQVTNEPAHVERSKSDAYTLGDFIKVK